MQYVFLMVLLVLSSSLFSVDAISSEQCYNLLQSSRNIERLDLSPRFLYKQCHLKGFEHVDYASLARWADRHKNKKRRMVICICATPSMVASKMAVEFLHQRGFSNVVYVDQGMQSMRKYRKSMVGYCNH